MTANEFRRIALGLDGAIESAHMGHPDFRAFGKIFATLHQGDKTGMVHLTPEQQSVFVTDLPSAFLPESGAWGRSGCTRVVLADVDPETLGEAMTLAWQNAAARAKGRTTKRPAAAKRAPAAGRTRTRKTPKK
jgi:hypothetical protein